MTFYNTNNQVISQAEWIKKFQPYYYLGGPTYGRRITRRNQGSKFVEEKIEKIMEKGLSQGDIPLIIAWKIGAIDHRASEDQQAIVYRNNFNTEFIYQIPARRLINAKNIINYCQENFDNLINNVNVEESFNNLLQSRGEGIGQVYCLSLIYFFTQGKWPIYDRYAHIALDAILLNKQPDELIQYRQINSWQNYCEKYVNNVKAVFGSQNISRDIDRSLWVYGHFYKSI